MAGISLNHAAAVADGGQDALSPPDALSARNMHHTENTLGTSDEHEMEDSLGKKQPPSTTEANNVEEDHDAGNAMHAVLNTSELLEMILSHFQTKDLTRFLAVSKYWQQSILRSIPFRRSLFLEAAPGKDYLQLKPVRIGPKGPSQLRFFLVQEPMNRSNSIIELHPALKIHSKCSRDFLYLNVRTGWMPCDSFQAVHPSTFLSQPPLKKLKIAYDKGDSGDYFRCLVECPSGVTFGEVLKALDALRMLPHPYNDELSYYSEFDDVREDGGEVFKFCAEDEVATHDSTLIRALEDIRRR